jgi:Holliday junction resolvasome RuvABC DNA-binding subunit
MLASRRLLFQSAGMRIVLELRDKLSAPVGETAAPAPSLSEIERDVLSALLNLGCAGPAAEQAVR